MKGGANAGSRIGAAGQSFPPISNKDRLKGSGGNRRFRLPRSDGIMMKGV
ncbi:hypothetical protein [Neisseria meningitidis serogroup B]|uniref:Uncharacterized protein n=1 Tax=Neisseria meningitidis serogroup B TaxID=491 RepID=A0A0H5QBS2_NEIMI|nr:hypothetical protein [Neisseria meningitidis serogroup B]